MIDGLPHWIDFLFLLTSVLTIVLFYYSIGKPKKIILFIIAFGTLISILAANLFFRVTDSIPPRFVLVLLPPTILIIYGLLPKNREWLLQNKNLKISTFIHSIRVPVEITLYYLFIYKTIPESLTFSGRNFDIIMGITAPIIGLLFLRKIIRWKAIIVWNSIGLFFIFFILIDGILSSELPFQQFAFDQPNQGMTYFPFILLPAILVPIVIYTHITDIIKIRSEIQKENRIIR